VRTRGLPTKIVIPRAANAVPRLRLFELLDRVREQHPLVWISAPAGWGKTYLVASYVAARGLPALWYRADARDADPANLFHYLETAARHASPGRKLRLPRFSPETQRGIEAFARHFFEALCAHRPVPSLIVIDDYQEAASTGWDDVLQHAFSAVPTGVSVIVISRGAPAPPFARSIAAGELASLGWEKLRFDEEETMALVRLHRSGCSSTQLKSALPRVMDLTNGWAAALVLLLKGAPGLEFETAAMEAAPEMLFDYFATEILNRASADEQQFLLKTSIVQNLSAPVAVQLTGSPHARTTLSTFARNGFLIEALDHAGSFRYHPLLRAFLQRRARALFETAEVEQLHRRAAQALLELGQIDEAIEQLEASGDFAGLASLLLSVAGDYVAAGRGDTLDSWIRRLPPGQVAGSAWLLYWKGVASLPRQPANSHEPLEQAYSLFQQMNDVSGLYLAAAAAMQARVHDGVDFWRLGVWIDRIQQLENEKIGCPDAISEPFTIGMLLAMSFWRPGTEPAAAWAARARAVAAQSRNPASRVMLGGVLSQYDALFGELAETSTTLDMLRAIAKADDASPLARLTLLQAEALYVWFSGNSIECVRIVRAALELASRTGVFVWNDILHALGAAAVLSMDGLESADEFLAPMGLSANRLNSFGSGNYHFHVSFQAFLAGDLRRALHSAEYAARAADAFGYPLARGTSQVALAQVYAALGRTDDATNQLEQGRRLAHDINCSLLLYAIELVEAEQSWDQDRERALACLRRGFGIARAQGYHNMFWLPARTMRALSVLAIEHGIEVEHVRSTMARRNLAEPVLQVRLHAARFPVQIRALGALEIASSVSPETADEPCRLRGKPRELLKAILAFKGRGVPDTQLIDIVWPDAEGDLARRVFDTTLHRLRRQLGQHGSILLNDRRVSLDERSCWVDVWALELAFAELDLSLTSSPAMVTLEAHAESLLELYRGRLLDHEADAPWLIEPRRKLNAKFIRYAQRLAAALQSHGSQSLAQRLHERALEVERPAEAVPSESRPAARRKSSV
jgi:ATP/maltotriose-dependent transcriptional regulator MalT/DNA-binding SARP family transcriptional activator